LGIETDEFDESITTFETRPGNYDMRNRIHFGEVTPTLKSSTGNDMYLLPSEYVHEVAYGFDQGATRDVGDNFFEEKSKTIANGSCPGHHKGVVSVDMGG